MMIAENEYTGEIIFSVLCGYQIYTPKINASYTLSNSTTQINETVTITSSNNNTNNYEMYELIVNDSKTYKFNVISDKTLDVRLYDEHMQLVNINMSLNNYNVSIEKYLSLGTYYFRVAYSDSNSVGTITTQINEHIHNYNTSYIWKNYTQHRASCSCGNTQLEAHMIAEGSFPGLQQYATCLLCGGLASVGFTGLSGLSRGTNLVITSNGSYILPNGVIVLVESDVLLLENGLLTINDFDYNNNYSSNNNVIMYNPKNKKE